MTYTKRQKFVYRFRQSINMLEKSIKYMNEVNVYLKESKYYKHSNKILKHLHNELIKSSKLFDEVNSMRLSRNGIFRRD